jgi:hypothetical protein
MTINAAGLVTPGASYVDPGGMATYRVPFDP